jgi:predicted acyltransferase
MPNFDFIVGVSCVLSLKKFVAKGRQDPSQKWAATRKIAIRSFKLFVIGIATQCGVGLFVYDLSKIRIMGILQRVACCYFTAAIFEVWLPAVDTRPVSVDSPRGHLLGKHTVIVVL